MQLRLTFLAVALAPALTAQEEAEDERLWGHSAHGAAYDEGPRQRPWIMEGIGDTPFPITSSNPEVQRWFDQGIALMHGFWWYEAERSFRWCLKLDPECAMAFWGMHLATREDRERSTEFLEQAVDRKDDVTERERSYIEVAEAFHAIREADDDERDDARDEAMRSIDVLLMDHPDDVEAKALYWLMAGRARRGGAVRYGMEAVLDDILERDPDHVGALHYRVHTWDGKEWHYAIDTCMKLGNIAPGCGHLLHMPGHVLSGIGLWHEAAIAMDRATRVEKAYMSERMILPESNWDYAHNLDYLCYIQEQLGMVDQALLGAEQLLKAPAFTESKFFGSMVKVPMVRALVKFERWEEILEEDALPFDPENPIEALAAAQTRIRALIGVGRLDEAEDELDDFMDELESEAPKGPPGGPPAGDDDDGEAWAMMRATKEAQSAVRLLEALLLLERDEVLEGIALLTEVAEEQADSWHNDPPHEPVYFYNLLGDAYLELGASKLAVECYERTLETVFHDGFALAGLVVAHHQLGNREEAEEAMAKLGVVWSDAQRPNRWLDAAEATGVTAEPHLDAPVEQRNYKREVLDVEGPSLWIPSALPNLAATDADGNEVTLADHRGENVLLIFYLGEKCVHCIEQINIAEERFEELADLDCTVLAVSRDTVERIADQQEGLEVTLLSDVEFANARRFHSYDDFEEIELHSTFLVNRDGRLHWSRIGGEPFTDFDYLIGELKRMNREAGEPLADAGDEDEADNVDGTGSR